MSTTTSVEKVVSPFEGLHSLIGDLSIAFSAIRSKRNDAQKRLNDVIEAIRNLTDNGADSTLGAIHLSREESPLKQPLYCTVLAELLADKLEYSIDARNKLLMATLCSNISFIEFQVLLNSMDGSLSQEQREKLRRHPEDGALLLEQAGIGNAHVIEVVRQHHERLDGSGYPRQLKAGEILTDALIVSLTDFYTAMIDNRAYRSSTHATDALRKMYEKASIREKPLQLNLVKAVGVFPPGTFVKLNSGEIALVIKRQSNTPTPIVRAIIDPAGQPYLGGIPRDCSQERYKVKAAHHLEKRPPMDLTKLFDT